MASNKNRLKTIFCHPERSEGYSASSHKRCTSLAKKILHCVQDDKLFDKIRVSLLITQHNRVALTGAHNDDFCVWR
jgi:hypothetical protein